MNEWKMARHPKTPAATLARLAKHEEVSVRRLVAEHANATPKILAYLARDPNHDVGCVAVSNPNFPADLLPKFVKDQPKAVAKHPAAPPELLARLVREGDVDVRMSVANRPELSVALQQGLLQASRPPSFGRVVLDAVQRIFSRWKPSCAQRERELLNVIAHHENLAPEILAQLAVHANADRRLRFKLACCVRTPADALTRLATDADAQVRGSVAANRATPPEVLAALAHDQVLSVRLMLAQNPVVSPGILRDLATQGVAGIADFRFSEWLDTEALLKEARAACAEADASGQTLLNMLALSALGELLRRHPNTPADLLEKLRSAPTVDLPFDLVSCLKAFESEQATVSEAFKEDLKTVLSGRLKEGLHLVPTDDDRFTQLGGQPLVSPPFAWPRWKDKSMSFLLQVKWSEVNGDGRLPDFPRAGLLYVFFDQEQSAWGGEHSEDRGAWKLVFRPETDDLKRLPLPDDLVDDNIIVRFGETRLSARCVRTLPLWTDELENVLNHAHVARPSQWLSAYLDTYEAQALAPFGGLPAHLLGGNPVNPDQDPEFELHCQIGFYGVDLACDEKGNVDMQYPANQALLRQAKAEWVLLLQIDTDEMFDMMWGDAGKLFFWIRKQDLAHLDFDNVWMEFQCG